jgi:hypothetical protein
MRRLNAAIAAAIIALLGLISAARAQSSDLYVLGAFLPSEPGSCFAVTFLLGILAVVGLIMATGPELYRVGLGVFAVSVIGAGAALKRGFDLKDRGSARDHADAH